MDYDAQYEKIYRYCFYKVKNKTVAEDITQETFLRFLDSGYSEQGKMLRYLYTIARNLCVDYYRRNEPELFSVHEMEHSKTEAPGFDEKTVMRTDIRRALERLSEEDCEMLLLKYANEEKDSVICALFGMSRFSLYRRLRRLTRLLKQDLSDYS